MVIGTPAWDKTSLEDTIKEASLTSSSTSITLIGKYRMNGSVMHVETLRKLGESEEKARFDLYRLMKRKPGPREVREVAC